MVLCVALVLYDETAAVVVLDQRSFERAGLVALAFDVDARMTACAVFVDALVIVLGTTTWRGRRRRVSRRDRGCQRRDLSLDRADVRRVGR